VNIQPITTDDVDRVVAFFGRVPEGDRTFFKEPFTGTETVRGWLADGSTRLIAVDPDSDPRNAGSAGESVIGYAAVVAGIGWSSHVGELRLVVDPAQRRRGIGHALAKAALAAALEAELSKVVVEAISTQDATIALFAQLGFVPEALLEGHVRDATGEFQDLLVLAMHGADTWATLSTVGLDTTLD
jgi:ribosomal protein S18 acetylase RimI-like enzyme